MFCFHSSCFLWLLESIYGKFRWLDVTWTGGQRRSELWAKTGLYWGTDVGREAEKEFCSAEAPRGRVEAEKSGFFWESLVNLSKSSRRDLGGGVNKHNRFQMQECTLTHSHLKKKSRFTIWLTWCLWVIHIVQLQQPSWVSTTNTFTTQKAKNWRGFPGFLLPLCPASLSDGVANLLAFLKILKVQPALEIKKKKSTVN